MRINILPTQLESDFYAVLAQLRDTPITVTADDETGAKYDVQVDDYKFVNYIVNLNFWWDDFTKVPAAIDVAANGDFGPAAQAWLSYVADRHGTTGPGTWTTTTGLYITAEVCRMASPERRSGQGRIMQR
ncbi:MAG: hypothetical protein R2911_21480 [Caldilineaceae bacterium]